MKTAVWHSESCTKPFVHALWKVIARARGLWFLLHCRCWWALTRTLPRYPVVAVCHGDPDTLGLWVRSLHMPQQITDGVDVGGQPSHNSGSGPLVCLPVLPCPHHQVELSSIAPTDSPLAATSEGWGQFSCFHTQNRPSHSYTIRASSSVLSRWGTGATLPSPAADKVSCLICCRWQGVRRSISHPPTSPLDRWVMGAVLPCLQLQAGSPTLCRACSPKCCSWWAAGTALQLLWPQGQFCICLRYWWGGGATVPCPCCNRTDGWWGQHTLAHYFRGLTHICLCQHG